MSAIRKLFRNGGSFLFRWTIRIGLVVGLYFIAILPYDLEVAGTCRAVASIERSVRAQIEDEIVKIFVSDDQWISEGQVIATLAVRDEQASVDAAKANLANKQAILDELNNGARQEDIAILEHQVEEAIANLEFAKIELARATSLFSEKNAVAERRMQHAQKLKDIATAVLAKAREELNKLKVGARPEEILAAQAEVQLYQSELEHFEKLVALGEIKAPISGRITTPNIQESVGHFVRPGDLIAAIQDDSTCQIEVIVDETDALTIETGMQVDVRFFGMDAVTLTGQVERISSYTFDQSEIDFDRIRTDSENYTKEGDRRDTNRFVRVMVKLDEHEFRIKPGMTGRARISIKSGLVWQAVARPIKRFVMVEVWSWLP